LTICGVGCYAAIRDEVEEKDLRLEQPLMDSIRRVTDMVWAPEDLGGLRELQGLVLQD
jgi:hypothetical protein